MPIINVEMLPGRSVEEKEAFAKAATDAFVATCGSTVENIHVIFREVETSNWYNAGSNVPPFERKSGLR